MVYSVFKQNAASYESSHYTVVCRVRGGVQKIVVMQRKVASVRKSNDSRVVNCDVHFSIFTFCKPHKLHQDRDFQSIVQY